MPDLNAMPRAASLPALAQDSDKRSLKVAALFEAGRLVGSRVREQAVSPAPGNCAARLDAAYDPNLVGGVAALTGRARVRRKGDWSGLYRAFSPAPGADAPPRLAPYYARANRGPSEMTIWLPLAN